MDRVRVCPVEHEYPYNPYLAYEGICDVDGIRSGDSSLRYYNLGDSGLITLLQSGPVAVSVSARRWEYYGSGIFSCNIGDPVTHAVLLVGYTQDYWIIKNQWGSQWGEEGYMRIARGDGDCQLGFSAFILVGAVQQYNGEDVYSDETSSDESSSTEGYYQPKYVCEMGLEKWASCFVMLALMMLL